MRLLARWLLPNQIDRFVGVLLMLYATQIGALALMSIIGPASRSINAMLLFAPYLAVCGAAFGAMGLWRWSVLRRRWPWVMGVVASLVTLPALLGGLNINLSSTYFPSTRSVGSVPREGLAVIDLVAISACWALIAFVVARLTQRGLTWVWRRATRLLTASRTRTLVVVALMLFAFSFFTRMNYGLSPLLVVIRQALFRFNPVHAIFFALLFTTIPLLIVLRSRSFWLGLVAGLAYLGLLTFSLAMVLLAVGDRVEPMLGGALTVFSFLVFLTGLMLRERPSAFAGARAAESTDNSDAEIVARESEARLPRTPSLWTFSLVILGLGLFVISLRYDLLTLMRAPPGQRWECARIVRAARTVPGAQGSANVDSLTGVPPGQMSISVDLALSGETPTDVFEQINTSKKMAMQWGIANMQPHVDVTPLIRNTFAVSIDGGQMTPEQFVKLVEHPGKRPVLAPYYLFNGVEIIDEPTPLTTSDFWDFYLTDLPEGSVARLLRTLVAGPKMHVVHIYNYGEGGGLSMDDWEQIVRVAQSHKVNVNRFQLTDELLEFLKQHPAKHLALTPDNLTLDQPSTWRVLLDTEIRVWLHWAELLRLPAGQRFAENLDDPSKLQLLFDAIFATKNTSSMTLPDDLMANTKMKEFRERCIEWHFAFDPIETRSADRIEHLYLPPTVSKALPRAGMIQELKELSLDAEWLPVLSRRAVVGPGNVGWHYYPDLDLSVLKKNKNLETLRIGLNQPVRNFRFLANLPKLKHLQVAAYSKVLSTWNPKDTPQLESLVLYGEPSLADVKRLARIPKLKRVVFVRWFDSVADPETEAKLLAVFPKTIEARFIDFDEFEPEIPELFRRHVEQIRRACREKYLAQPQRSQPASD